MSPRGRRIAFGLAVILFGTLVLSPLVIFGVSGDPFALGVLCELVVLGVGIGISITDPPPAAFVPPAPAPAPAFESSAYRGPMPPAHPIDPITKASAKRLTVGILAALVFTGAAVPFAVHLPRWVEVELVIALWWAMWSAVLAVVAYRGAKVEDDHRSGGPIIDTSSNAPPLKPKWTWLLEGLGNPEGCLVALGVLLVVGIAFLGAWLVVELIAPAVFIVAYRGVMRALAKAHAANSRGDAMRSTLSGMGWAALGTAPLALLVALVHALFTV